MLKNAVSDYIKNDLLSRSVMTNHKILNRLLVFIAFFFVAHVLSAQINHPKASPSSRVEQEVGLSKITIQYARPAVRGRKIFGDLVPYGRIWRVGANESTKITVDSDINVMGNSLPMGTYALYAFPEEREWEIVFHSNIAHWGDGRNAYDPEEDVFRIKVKPEELSDFQENFLISFDSLTHDSLTMQLLWEYTKISIPISFDTYGLMQEEIQKKLQENPTAQTYYEAGRYLQEQGNQYKTALGYLNKAIELGGDTYYFYRVKSLVEAALEEYDSAILSAKKSMELAGAQDKDEFVRMNQKNIELWTARLKNHKK